MLWGRTKQGKGDKCAADVGMVAILLRIVRENL